MVLAATGPGTISMLSFLSMSLGYEDEFWFNDALAEACVEPVLWFSLFVTVLPFLYDCFCYFPCSC
jgi:hypothetical protein